MMRTTARDVLRLAWWLLRRRKLRQHLRIGQIVGNINCSYYLENETLLAELNRVYER